MANTEVTEPLALDKTLSAVKDAILQVADSINNERERPTIYGYKIIPTETYPYAKIQYIEDAVGMTPAYMDYANDVFNYGSWPSAWFIRKCNPCILSQTGNVLAYLDKDDYTKDVNGNSVVIDSNLTDANVMIEFPKVWYKITAINNIPHIYISSVKIDDDYKDYAYIDNKGVHKEHFYEAAFNGSLVDGVMRSISGASVSKDLNASTEVSYCRANGNGWNSEDLGERQLINILLILMGKSLDTQTVFGRGIDTGGETAFNEYLTGTANNKGLFYGTNTGTFPVKVFGIENYWGLQWRRYAGEILNNGRRLIKMCYGNADGSTTFDYNYDGTGYVDIGVVPSGSSGGYISEMEFNEYGMFAKTVSGSSSIEYCDGLWYNLSIIAYAVCGGDSGYGLLCGAFYVSLGASPGFTWWNYGVAVSYK